MEALQSFLVNTSVIENLLIMFLIFNQVLNIMFFQILEIGFEPNSVIFVILFFVFEKLFLEAIR